MITSSKRIRFQLTKKNPFIEKIREKQKKSLLRRKSKEDSFTSERIAS